MDRSLKLLAMVVTAYMVACSPGKPPAASAPGPTPHATAVTASPATTANETPTPPEVASRLGRAPGNCRGPEPRPRIVTGAYGKLVGEKPLWAGFYATYQENRHAYAASDAPRKRYGFRIKVLWIMAPSQQEPVMVTGSNLDNGAPLFFQVEGEGQPAATAALDPAGGVSETDWGEFPSYMYFDRAGCFELEAVSSNESWRLVFGLGR